MKSVDGETKRIYSYIGESDKNIKVYADLTQPKNDLNLFNSLSKEAE